MHIPAVDRSILITGASSGIGLAAATIMAGRGWRVFATVRREEDQQRLAGIAGVTPLLMDYADPASIAATADAVLQVLVASDQPMRAVRATIHSDEPDVPVILFAPAPTIARDPELAEGAKVRTDTLTRAAVVRAVQDAIGPP